ARILDFGIARPEAAGHTLTTQGTVMGTPRYMSPEQIEARPLDRRTDIYSFGAGLYFLVTGIEPFDGKDVQELIMKHLHGRARPPHDLHPTPPPRLSDVILRALDPDRDRRFQTIAELAAALLPLLQTSAA